MSATALAALIAVVAGYASSIYFIVSRFDAQFDRMGSRLDRIEERLTTLEISVARIGQRLDDHVEHHP